MQAKNQISLTRKTLYGIMLFGLFFSAFGVGNLPSVRAQEGETETPIPISPTQLPDFVLYTDPQFTIEIPRNWFVTPSFSQGVLPNLKGTAFSSYSLDPDISGFYNSSGTLFIVSLEAINAPVDLSLSDFIKQNYGLDYMRIIGAKNLPNGVDLVEAADEQSQIYYVKYKEQIFSLTFPWNNSSQDKGTLFQTVN